MAVINDLSGAIDEYRANAADMFNAANNAITSPEDKDNLGKLAAGMAQLLNAATMESAQQGRDGYAEVVKLMVTTATHGEAIAKKLADTAQALATGNTNFTRELDMIRVLTEALRAVAQLSPAAVWQKSNDAG